MTLGAGFTLAGTASAVIQHHPDNYADYDLHLADAHHGATFASKSQGTCKAGETPQGFPYAWHFVVPDYSAAKNALPDVTKVYAYFDGAVGAVSDGNVVQRGKGWNVYTANAGTLLDAVGDSTATHDTPLVMNLSHTCGPAQSSSSSSSSLSSSSDSSSSSSLSSSSDSSSSSSSSSTTSSSSTSATSTSRTITSSSTSTSSTELSSSELSSSDASVEGSSIQQSSVVVSGVASGQSPTTVKGEVIGRTLPRTGFDPGILLMLGGLLVISGVLMLRYSDDTI